jgi:hypothetical protein
MKSIIVSSLHKTHLKATRSRLGLFINILRTIFLLESRFGSFFSSYMYVTCSMFVRKTRAYKVDEIDGWSILTEFFKFSYLRSQGSIL